MSHTTPRGWVPDLPDHRDQRYAAPSKVLRKLPSSVNLTKLCPPVYNQGEMNSCTAHAIGAAYQFELLRQNRKDVFMPSRLFIYYNERAMEGNIKSDSGAMIRNGIKSVNKQGVCPEAMWPYDFKLFATKPNKACYTKALQHQVLSYQRVQRTLTQMKSCLAEGYPFVFGFTVFDSFDSPQVKRSGKLNMPKKNEKDDSGHAVLAVGYSDSAKRFIVRNSYGRLWGKQGYFTMPYDYLLDEDLADDFWTLRVIE
jgi:C1A family cysteine protease